MRRMRREHSLYRLYGRISRMIDMNHRRSRTRAKRGRRSRSSGSSSIVSRRIVEFKVLHRMSISKRQSRCCPGQRVYVSRNIRGTKGRHRPRYSIDFPQFAIHVLRMLRIGLTQVHHVATICSANNHTGMTRSVG